VEQQPTREQLLHTEAARYGVSPALIDRAVGIIAAVQRRDRADFRRNFGGELTPDRWLAAYGVSGFKELCAYAAQKSGLSDDGNVIMRIVSAIAPEPEQRADDRPVQYWARPLTDSAEVRFPAYRVVHETPETGGGIGVDWSGALLRRTLRGAIGRGLGAASLEEATGVVVFTDGHLHGAHVARPAPGHIQPQCARCGQWENEHSLPERFGSCQQFTTSVSRLNMAGAL
jgi:hypothetical protein